ncbi:hypothetical protein [Methanobrevibacter sp.]|jgi:hypothetical protein|uniref:hypothetical protein n=1 Tax=Methanobrevibacter sp. TaxID=66852 RepID=UPI003865CB98
MGIKVIEQNTNERNQQTIQLFQKIKPYLDEGHSFTRALTICGYKVYNYKSGWFKHLIDYAKTQGYDYNEMRGRRKF